ncbi:MAG: hypothetical protein ACNA78_05990 [Balneolaceae bacterium]
MSTNAEQERERLKEEYKEHYRAIRDAKEKLRRSRYTRQVTDAMQQMNADSLLESVDNLLGKIRHSVASIEARLDVAMEAFDENENSVQALDDELEKAQKKKKAAATLREIKHDMGLIYNEIEQQALDISNEKTVGPSQTNDENDGS